MSHVKSLGRKRVSLSSSKGIKQSCPQCVKNHRKIRKWWYRSYYSITLRINKQNIGVLFVFTIRRNFLLIWLAWHRTSSLMCWNCHTGMQTTWNYMIVNLRYTAQPCIDEWNVIFSWKHLYFSRTSKDGEKLLLCFAIESKKN